MNEKNPFESSNGLRVTDRTSQSITLEWPVGNTFIISELSTDDGSSESATLSEEKLSSGTEDGNNEGEDRKVGRMMRDGNWFEIEMKKEQATDWSSVYKGYGNKCKVDGLAPDLALIFRMKRNHETEWGTDVEASTAPSPPSTEDLNRAVEMNSEYLVSRILKLTRSLHLKKILSARDRNGMTPLMVACHIGNVQIAEKLILAGSNVNAQSSGVGRTALMFASIVGHQTVVVLLDKYKVNWRLRDRSGLKTLDYAIIGGHVAIVKLAFCRLGSKCIHERDGRHGWTPLMRAATLSDSLDVLKFLINKGSNINATDNCKNKSVLMAAVIGKKPKFVRYLLEKRADPYFQNLNGKNCLEMSRVLGYREVTEAITEHIKSLEPKT